MKNSTFVSEQHVFLDRGFFWEYFSICEEKSDLSQRNSFFFASILCNFVEFFLRICMDERFKHRNYLWICHRENVPNRKTIFIIHPRGKAF